MAIKKLLLAMFVMLLVCAPINWCLAQDGSFTEESPIEDGKKTTIFYGANWKSGIGVFTGGAFQLGGDEGKVYVLTKVRFGLDTTATENGLQNLGNADLQFAYKFWTNQDATINLYALGGTGVDWTDLSQDAGGDITYWNQAVGGLFTYTLPNTLPLLSWVLADPYGLALSAEYTGQLFTKNTALKPKINISVAFWHGV